MKGIKNLMAKTKKACGAACGKARDFIMDDDGMEVIQVIFIVLIAVVLGGLLLTFGQNLFTNVQTKVEDNFNI